MTPPIVRFSSFVCKYSQPSAWQVLDPDSVPDYLQRTQIVCGIVFIQLEFSYPRSEGRDANAELSQCQFGKGTGYYTGDGFTG